MLFLGVVDVHGSFTVFPRVIQKVLKGGKKKNNQEEVKNIIKGKLLCQKKKIHRSNHK